MLDIQLIPDTDTDTMLRMAISLGDSSAIDSV